MLCFPPQNCRTVGTVSSLMGGIAYTGLIYTKMAYFQQSSLLQQFLYITGLVVCMGLSLRNVFGTTMLTMLGPGKALRGPDGSMHSAVDGMLDAFEGIVIVQHLTIYSFMATAVVYTWGAASMSIVASILLSLVVISLTYTMCALSLISRLPTRVGIAPVQFPSLYSPPSRPLARSPRTSNSLVDRLV
jgi:hypothetical protein